MLSLNFMQNDVGRKERVWSTWKGETSKLETNETRMDIGGDARVRACVRLVSKCIVFGLTSSERFYSRVEFGNFPKLKRETATRFQGGTEAQRSDRTFEKRVYPRGGARQSGKFGFNETNLPFLAPWFEKERHATQTQRRKEQRGRDGRR